MKFIEPRKHKLARRIIVLMDILPLSMRNCLSNILPHPYSSKNFEHDYNEAVAVFRKGNITPRLKKDIRYWTLFHGFPPDEYFLLNFDKKSTKERNRYISNGYKDYVCRCLGNFNEMGMLLMDKYRTYLKFEEFFKRDVIQITSAEDYHDFRSFVKKHPTFIKKPINQGRGTGIEKISVDSSDNSVEAEFKSLIRQVPVVCEEILENSPEWPNYNPDCLSTVRVSAFHTADEITIFHPYVRFGNKGKVVDNAGSGGLLCAVDAETGIIVSHAVDEYGESYKVHPVTGNTFEGTQLPHWNEVKDIVRKLFEIVPDLNYVGWDLSYTTKGWVMIEGNNGGQLHLAQYATQEPFRNELNRILERL